MVSYQKVVRAFIKLGVRLRGFTLLELILTIAIIAVLAAISAITYRGYRDRTNNAIAISDISNIQTSIERYYTVNNRYPATAANITLPNGGKDPWGNAYVYLNIIDGGPGVMGNVRKDHALNPINTHYDLYSMGKDGATKNQITQKDSLDDIIMARDGGFIGLAADF